MKKIILFIPTFLLLILGCRSNKGQVVKDGRKTIEGTFSGYSFSTLASTGDKPGLIYRITPEGKKFAVAVLDSVNISRDTVQAMTRYSKNLADIGGIFEFTGTKGKVKLADSLNKSKQITFAVNFGAGIFREQIYDLDLLKASSYLARVESLIALDIKRHPERLSDKYFLIREAVSSNNFQIVFERSVGVAQSLNIAIENIVKANPNFRASDKDSLVCHIMVI